MNRRPQFPDRDIADPAWWAVPLVCVLAALGGSLLSYMWSAAGPPAPAAVSPEGAGSPVEVPPDLASAPALPRIDHSHLLGAPQETSDAPTF